LDPQNRPQYGTLFGTCVKTIEMHSGINKGCIVGL